MGADPPTVERVVRVRAAFVERLLLRAESAWWRRDLFDAGLPQVRIAGVRYLLGVEDGPTEA
jgi:hypothetical protein